MRAGVAALNADGRSTRFLDRRRAPQEPRWRLTTKPEGTLSVALSVLHFHPCPQGVHDEQLEVPAARGYGTLMSMAGQGAVPDKGQG